MKLSRPAIFLLVAIWAVILLAPPLNLLFRIQLRGSETIRFSALPAPDAIPNFWEKTARRFPDDKNVLLQAALEYPVDENAAENDEEYFGEYDEEYYPPPPSPGEPVSPDAPPPYVPTLNPNLPASQVFPGRLEADPNREKVRRLDFLLRKFPGDSMLIAVQLRAMITTLRAERIGGELSDTKNPAEQPEGYVSPERNKEKTNFTPADFQKAIALCARGQKLEPDNGFFDWVKCYFLLHAWRDAEALNALDSAAQKKRHNGYAFDQYRLKTQVLATALGRELLHEEKSIHLFTDISSLSSRYREMARILSWQSIKAQRRGDHAQALRIAAGLARTAAKIREDSKTYIDGLVARAIESMAWSAPTRAVRQPSGQRISPNQRIASFREYATKHGRPELAAEAARNSAAGAAFSNAINTRMNNSAFGLPFWVFVSIDLLWKAGVLLLVLLPLALLLTILMAILSRVPRLRRVLRLRETTSQEMPAPREVWNGALACGGLRALGTLICGAIVIGLCSATMMIGAGQGEQVFTGIKEFFDNFTTQGGTFGIMQGMYYSLSQIGEPPPQWRYAALFSPLLFGVLYVAWRATEWQKRADGETNFRWGALFKSLLQGHAFRASRNAAERAELNIGGAVLQLLGFALTGLLAVAWIVLAFNPTDDGTFFWLLPLFFAALFAAMLLAEKFVAWRNRPRRAATIRYGARLFGRSLATWLVLGSALYLVLLLISLPLRSRADAGVERTLKIGEVRAAYSETVKPVKR